MLKIQFKDKRQDPLWVVEKVFTIGSAVDNSLIIADESVSAHHARLVHESQRFLLQDTGSSRGTFVNGQRITQRQVGCGDTIRCGDVEIDLLDPFASSAEQTATQTQDTSYWALIADATWLAGQEFPLPLESGQSLLLGRGSHCDIVFPGTHLAREHARLTLNGNHIRVTDLNTATGTYINDERAVGEATAVAGDRLRFDIYSFTLLGPGIALPQSATAHTEKFKTATAAPVEQPQQPKRWKTRPTSPGNREERLSTSASPIIIVASLLMLVALIAIAAYLLLT